MMLRDPRGTIFLVTLVLLVSLAVRAQDAPAAQDAIPPAPVQPVPYSHKLHVGLGLQCLGCHVNPDQGRLMTFPPTTLCMGCHQAIARDRPSIQTLTALAGSGKPIPWVRVYQLPDYVFWQHSTHLEAGVSCTDCHGPVAERDVIALETNVTRMIGCVTCHDKRQAFTDCASCHDPRH